MDYMKKLETMVAGWHKGVPHLPVAGQKWLAANIWWIVLVGAIISGISVLFALGGLFTLIALVGAVSSSYYVYGGVTSWAILSSLVALLFTAAAAALLALAVKPLKERQKKGWVILFATLLLNTLAVVVNAVLSFSVFGFVFGIIFGAIFLGIYAYFLYEIHGQFAHPAKKTTKKA